MIIKTFSTKLLLDLWLLSKHIYVGFYFKEKKKKIQACHVSFNKVNHNSKMFQEGIKLSPPKQSTKSLIIWPQIHIVISNIITYM